jgi:hypothetical protein
MADETAELEAELATEATAEGGGEQTGSEDGKAEPKPAGAVPVGKQRPPLPDGVVSPIGALNHLKQKGHAPADFKPQQMYGFVKSPGKTDPFPVQHYDATGTAFNEPQVNEHGITTTRPGVKTDEVVIWWSRKGERDAAKAKERAEKAKAKAEKAKADAEKAAAASSDQTAQSANGEVVASDVEDVGPMEEAE